MPAPITVQHTLSMKCTHSNVLHPLVITGYINLNVAGFRYTGTGVIMQFWNNSDWYFGQSDFKPKHNHTIDRIFLWMYSQAPQLKRKCCHFDDFSSLATPKAVILITFGAASDENSIQLTTFPFKWRTSAPPPKYQSPLAKAQGHQCKQVVFCLFFVCLFVLFFVLFFNLVSNGRQSTHPFPLTHFWQI